LEKIERPDPRLKLPQRATASEVGSTWLPEAEKLRNDRHHDNETHQKSAEKDSTATKVGDGFGALRTEATDRVMCALHRHHFAATCLAVSEMFPSGDAVPAVRTAIRIIRRTAATFWTMNQHLESPESGSDPPLR